jgi:hypothetical protein
MTCERAGGHERSDLLLVLAAERPATLELAMLERCLPSYLVRTV